jgi:hypothetical protein
MPSRAPLVPARPFSRNLTRCQPPSRPPTPNPIPITHTHTHTQQVFVSDGAKCDIARLQLMFGQGVVTAVQDPSYPVYVDTAVIMGQTGTIDEAREDLPAVVILSSTPVSARRRHSTD